MALESTPPLSIKNTCGTNRNIALEVDGNNSGYKSLRTLGGTAGLGTPYVSMLSFLGYSPGPPPVLLTISAGASGFWYFTEFGVTCSNNNEYNTITVTCATAWTILLGGSWVHTDVSGGSGSGVVNVTVDPLGSWLTFRDTIIRFEVASVQQAVAHIHQMAPGEACV